MLPNEGKQQGFNIEELDDRRVASL